MLPRRSVQLLSLALFLGGLAGAAFSLPWLLPKDLFLRLDPVLMGATGLSARALSWAALPALVVLISAPFLGRVFCGYVCPLGTTLDGADKLFSGRGEKAWVKRLRSLGYWILLALLGSALAGVSLVFAASPLALITRFYGLLIHPLLAFLADLGLGAAEPLIQRLDLNALLFAQVRTPRFATQFFILTFFGLLFGAAALSPRFWCRYLCPSGALLGLLSRRPLVRRRVSQDCLDCGKCQKACPMGAIPENPLATNHQECLVCRTCQEVCPVGAVGFAPGRPAGEAGPAPFSPQRRGFILSAVGGLALGLTGRTGLGAALPGGAVGRVLPPGLVRPPGALPESAFLAACVRCGECMLACPTNTLQPIWFKAGLLGLFSPALTARRGPCDPRCSACGRVCPTGAIRPLDGLERVWAKTGTAVIDRARCLAWEQDKKCLVCDEVCPFDAVEFRAQEGLSVTVPHVVEDRCAGCGYCEHQCPVQNRAAIVVHPQGEIRLARGSYQEEAKARGLSLSIREKREGGQGLDPGYPQGQPQGGGSGFED